jgi:diguanylate cyclase (GGDEF)-like protein
MWASLLVRVDVRHRPTPLEARAPGRWPSTLSPRTTATATALLFIDLDDFRAVNDQHGHSAGDALLHQVAARLRAAVRADDLLACQGGDEFLLLLTDLPGSEAHRIATRTADQLLHALRDPFDVHHTKITVRASIGISIAPPTGVHADDLLRQADTAMYTAKSHGGAQHHSG